MIWARTAMVHRVAFALTGWSVSLTLALIGVLLILVLPTAASTRVGFAKDDTVDPAPADSGIEGQVFISPPTAGRCALVRATAARIRLP